MLKILNLYAGIGGNRKLWGNNFDITAVEINEKIANCYQELFPNDKVIIGDAHEFLRLHFREYDFIWASPPCPTHSVLQMTRYYDETLKYPDMTLYQEIIWLQTFYKGKWVIENVKPYYNPLISPSFIMDRHYFWSSDFILNPQINDKYDSIRSSVPAMAKKYGYNLEVLKKYDMDYRTVLRNTVVPEIGKYILEKIIGGSV